MITLKTQTLNYTQEKIGGLDCIDTPKPSLPLSNYT